MKQSETVVSNEHLRHIDVPLQSTRESKKALPDEVDEHSIMSNKNKAISAVICSAIVLGGVGCESDTGNGALIGGGVGALAGGIIGHQSGHAVGGALIGGAVGAGTGALVGHASDKNKEAKRDAYDKGYYQAQRDNARATPNTQRDGYYGR